MKSTNKKAPPQKKSLHKRMNQGANWLDCCYMSVTYFIILFLLSCFLSVGVAERTYFCVQVVTKLKVRHSSVIITSCLLIPYLPGSGEHLNQWFGGNYGFIFHASLNCNLYRMHFVWGKILSLLFCFSLCKIN